MHAMLAAAPKVNTSVAGVHAFAAPEKGFNALTASNSQLLAHGLPARPNKATDPVAFRLWERGMSALKTRAVDVKATPYYSTNMRSITTASSVAPSGSVSAVPTQYSSSNWSGIANTKAFSKWSATGSYDEVVSIWNVPVSNHPFGSLPCSEGPWFEVTWNGIDGFKNGDVVQGGSADYWDDGGCGGPVQYYGWVEWYPSYPILAIYCGSSLCPVGPGDDFYVVTYGAKGTAEQFVFVEDVTQQWSGTFGMTYVTGPGVVGNSAEYIVERPCCVGSNPYPLANYVYEFFNYSFAYSVNGTLSFPGSTSPATAIITMYDDSGSQAISYPFMYGTSGNQGRYSIFMSDENCAYSGGCTP